ncbi:MAG: diacylglycerol/lipid kinase family protein [Fimbriiglobus sp.]
MRTALIFNPQAGRGQAIKTLERNRHWLPAHELFPTSCPGDAIRLAKECAMSGFERIAALGGDGTAHEVANGILQSERSVLFSAWPLGSSNDYARTCGMNVWWKREGRMATSELLADVGVVHSEGRERYFINGCGIGFNGMVTFEAHKIDWLRGMPLYVLAFLRAMRKHYLTPMTHIEMDGTPCDRETLSISFNLAQREGGFPVTWEAKLDDGQFEVFHAAKLKRWQLVRYLPALITGRLPTNHSELRRSQAVKVKVSRGLPWALHTDGELFTTPDRGECVATIELLPKRLRVEVIGSEMYQH